MLSAFQSYQAALMAEINVSLISTPAVDTDMYVFVYTPISKSIKKKKNF